MTTAERETLLIVEDDAGLRTQLNRSFDRYQLVMAEDRASALAQLRLHTPAVVTVNLGLPPSSDAPSEGLMTITEILASAPQTKVIAITGQSDRANAVLAIAKGAYDFFAKPFDAATLGVVVDRAFGVARLERHALTMPPSPSLPHSPMRMPGLLTLDPGMLKVCDQTARLAPTAACVMLLGESGAGKELLARALHDRSARRDKRFVAINCAAAPESLLETGLFGHPHGAWAGGATGDGVGGIETADGGTLFLDEVGDLPPALQPRLLRFLQDHLIERAGTRVQVAVDVRVVCATHRDLRAMIAAGTFREDLYFRLAELEVAIPPLRERGGDAVMLARLLASRFARQVGRSPMTIGDDALRAIERHRWPGNVRELENAVRRAVIFAEGEEISADDLGIYWGADSQPDCDPPDSEAGPGFNLRELKDHAQRQAVAQALERTGGNIAGASRILGVSRPALYELLSRFGLR